MNVTCTTLLEKPGFPTLKHHSPYKLQWFNKYGEVRVTKRVFISFSIESYKDKVLYDVVSMHVGYILLGRP